MEKRAVFWNASRRLEVQIVSAGVVADIILLPPRCSPLVTRLRFSTICSPPEPSSDLPTFNNNAGHCWVNARLRSGSSPLEPFQAL